LEGTVLRALASANPASHGCGQTAFEEAQVDQWLDFAALELSAHSGAAPPPVLVAGALQRLDSVLEGCTWLVGHRRTVADLAVVRAIEGRLIDDNDQTFGGLSHVKRWAATVRALTARGTATAAAAPAAKATAKAAAGGKKEAAAKAPAVAATAAAAGPALPAAAAAATAKVAAAGDAVRALKAAKADKDAVMAAVGALNEAKAAFKAETGEDYVAPASEGGGKARESKAKAPKAKAAPKEPKAPKAPKAAGGGGGAQGKKGDTKKVSKLALEHTREGDFAAWYPEVVVKAEMLSYGDISGCYILRPLGYGIWEFIQKWFDKEIKLHGVENCYFPMFATKAALEAEKDHVEGFAAEVAWVTRSGDAELAEPIAVRPTSETIMYGHTTVARWRNLAPHLLRENQPTGM
jgi:hypothetical protein